MDENYPSRELILERLKKINAEKPIKPSTQGRSARQDIKLLYIRDYLHKYTNKENPKNANDIIEYLESKNIKAERKTIYNDIKKLKEELEEPIEYNKKKHGYYIAKPIFSLYELQILTDCVRASDFLSSEEVSSINNRIAGLTNIYDCEALNNIKWIDEHTARPINSELSNVDLINKAIAENRKISFRYFEYHPTNYNRSSGGKVYQESYTGSNTFIVSPQKLYRTEGHYMLVTYCTDSRIKKLSDYLFTVRKMEDIVILPSERECHDTFKPEIDISAEGYYNRICAKFLDSANRHFAAADEDHEQFIANECEKMKNVIITAENELFEMIFYYDNTFTITLLFDKRDSVYVMDEFGYDTVIVPLDDQHCTATLRIRVSRQFFNWLFANQPMITIEDPPHIIKLYQRYLLAIMKQHDLKHMEQSQVIGMFMDLMKENVTDKELLKSLQERYPVIEDIEDFETILKLLEVDDLE